MAVVIVLQIRAYDAAGHHVAVGWRVTEWLRFACVIAGFITDSHCCRYSAMFYYAAMLHLMQRCRQRCRSAPL